MIPSLNADAPTAQSIRKALDDRATTAVFELTSGDPRSDVRGIETKAAKAEVNVIAGYSLGSHVGLRALLRKPHLSCDGLWFCPAPDGASRVGRQSIPHYLRKHMDYLALHLETFQPADMVESLDKLSGRHLFIFGKNDDLRIQGEKERIDALELDHVRTVEVLGNHFLADSVIQETVAKAFAEMGEAA